MGHLFTQSDIDVFDMSYHDLTTNEPSHELVQRLKPEMVQRIQQWSRDFSRVVHGIGIVIEKLYTDKTMRQEGGERLSPMSLTTTIIGGMNLHNAAVSKPVTPSLKVFERSSKS